MFSEVSPRYDLLNGLLSLGQDRAWRRELGRKVPEAARRVADVCCGSGASLAGLRRPGRLLLGFDGSPSMLELAASRYRRKLGGPKLVRADAFELPLGSASLDAITIAFGLRNLRPRPEALGELARVLRPGGTLAVLEATAPAPGPWAPFHRFYLERVVPALGWLSPDPRAYRYLSRSIQEFGDGRELAAEMHRVGLHLESESSFLWGATRLWVASRQAASAQSATSGRESVQEAMLEPVEGPAAPTATDTRDREWRLWRGALAVLHMAYVAALGFALSTYGKLISERRLTGWAVTIGWIVLVLGLIYFAARALVVLSRLRYPPEDR